MGIISVIITGTDLVEPNHDSATINLMQIDEDLEEGSDMIQMDVEGNHKSDEGMQSFAKVGLTIEDAENLRDALDITISAFKRLRT